MMLYIIRGLPGSGKTTLAHRLCELVCEADHYMVDEQGDYKFDPARLRECHDKCYIAVARALRIGLTVAVSNTFSQRWEFAKYVALAEDEGVAYQVITCEGDPLWQNVHNVPKETIQRMKDRWEL